MITQALVQIGSNSGVSGVSHNELFDFDSASKSKKIAQDGHP